MPYIDLLIIVIVLIFAGKGFWKGFFNEALTFVGFFVALFVTAAAYRPLGQMLAGLLNFNPPLSSVIVFVLLFILITFAFGLAGQVLTKATKKLKLSSLNRTFGAVFGGLKGAFICGIFMAVLMEKKLFVSLTGPIQNSALAPYLMGWANAVLGLFNAS
ncbi:MAG: CvpA family protein [Myxococcales bacterium]|nr:CvpA family protein [Myxococcales bacterium]